MSFATGPSEQAANQPSAADLSAQAIERFQARDYDAAVRLFEEAYAIDRVPNYLFNIGRVYEEKGDIRSAVDYYQRFVKEPGVEIEARDLALQRLRVLKGILQETDPAAKPAPVAATPEPVVEGPKPAPEPPRPAPPDPKWRTMKLTGAGLLGAGGGALIVGAVLGGLTLSKQNQLDTTHDWAARQDLVQGGQRLAVATDVLLIGGAVVALTGAILLGVGVSKGKSKNVAERRVLPTGTGLVARF
ncbi:tetratricopeptide repeat protein [Nannocystis bainbridge]|uniref:Tetratricopeptide repeat protein n=1 Tax=Nannocystis bainbridge TaxID=2995303 RepID=A0ABT5E3F2_9BACT|nr:tetratricopeptide repeat protein [Nannocystis bainbridge]MDC0719844.1 tetratricopeptide repeat protein [Nannocystis bainbridge]